MRCLAMQTTLKMSYSRVWHEAVESKRVLLIHPSCRDTRTSKTLAIVVAIDKTNDLAKTGFLGEVDFNPSDR